MVCGDDADGVLNVCILSSPLSPLPSPPLPSPPSVLWKIVVETGSVSSVLIKIAQRTQPKKLAAFMRKFVDYVIMSLPPATPSMDHLDTVWECGNHGYL